MKKKLRGFAAMSKEKRVEIARRGGHRAHALGVAHKFTAEEARIAGSIGGKNRYKNRRTEQKTT